MFRLILLSLLCGAVCLCPSFAGEAVDASVEPELKALERAIAREMNSGHLGSQTLGDLTRLRRRLLRIRDAAQAEQAAERTSALQPVGGGDAQPTLERLRAEAQAGGRPERRALALYYLFLNDNEKALAEWRAMGRATDADQPFAILSAYMELALGEYNAARNHLDNAIRFMDSRTTLVLSRPEFCYNVGGYRIFTPRTGGDILPGEDVLIYVEVEGTEFYPAPDGGVECRLMFGLKLKNEAQGTVWAEANYGEYTPVFSGRVRDLHAALTWRVPNDLAAGRYHLHVEALEKTTSRRGENVIAFTVGKRETNPEKRVTGGAGNYSQEEIQRTMRDAGRPFSGWGSNTGGAATQERQRDPREFEIVKQYEQSQKVDR